VRELLKMFNKEDGGVTTRKLAQRSSFGGNRVFHSHFRVV